MEELGSISRVLKFLCNLEQLLSPFCLKAQAQIWLLGDLGTCKYKAQDLGRNYKFWKKDECWILLRSFMATGRKPVFLLTLSTRSTLQGFDLDTQNKMGVFSTAP